MPLGKRQRKILKAVGLGLGGLVAAWILLPVWFPWVLRPFAQKQGVHYVRYERLGYRRFALRGITFTNQAVTVRAEGIEAWTPGVWFWRWLAGSTNEARPFARVNGWQVDIASTEGNGSGGRGGSVYASFEDVGAAAGVLGKWVPTAAFSNGVIRVEQPIVEIPNAAWSAGKLSAKTFWPQQRQSLLVSVDLRKARSAEVELNSESLRLRSTVQLSAQGSGLKLQSASFWRSNRIEIEAAFGRSGTLPETASLRAPNIRLPAELVGLDGYLALTGSLSGAWKDGGFLLDAHAEALAPDAETNLPPATVQLHARGDANSATIESAVISSPWLQAELSQGLNVHFSGAILREPATFKFTADLARQPWTQLQGILKGEADLTPGAGDIPRASFHVSGLNTGNTEIKARTFEASGNLNWPWLEVDSARADFEGGSSASASGKMDLDKRVVSGGWFTLRGSLVQRWLPAGYGFDVMSATGKFAGPINRLTHSGHVEVIGFASPELRPLQVQADWDGQRTFLREAEVVLATTNSALRAQGSLEISATGTKAVLNRLSLTNHGQAVLELEAPATVSLSGEPGGTNAWQAGIESFKWRGSAGKIEAQAALNWPRAGDIRCAIEQLRSDLFQDFFKFPLQQIEIRKLDAFTGWTNGPMTFGIELSGTALPPRELAVLESGRGLPRSNRGSEFAEDDPRARARSGSATNFADLLASPVEVELKLRGDQRGVTLSNLVVNSQTSSVAVAHGFLPLTLSPGSRTNFFHMEIERPLQLTASTQPHPFFWGSVADWTGLILRDPSLALDVSGTWNAPQGEVRLAARQIQIPEARFPSAPSLENLRLALILDLDKARLTECQMLLQGQPLTVTGEMPLGGGFWRALRERRLPNWEQATGSLKMKDADFAVFAAALPEVVSPAGKLNLELTLLPGGNLTGELEVQGARTRSLPNAGPIRDIGFHLTFLNRIVKLVSATGRIGEAPISVTGQADLSGTNWYQGWVPPFEVVLRGTNVPLSRQPDSVIRSDLDLTIRKTNAAPAVISGQARLRDSFYLSDLAGLIPGQVASPEQRPPFFSIEEQPLAGWRLAVLVTGVRCLGVRTTLFNGDVSANLQILGTLKEPVALGDARIETGTVRFPFAALKVRQGFVTLSSQDPYHPQLQISAASKEYGYDINLQVTGPADAPIVQFTSVPPLSSEQIVLLVTAGEIPTQSHLTSEQRAQTVAVFLGRDLLTTLGFSDAGESRLTFHSGEQLTEQGGPTYNLEYKLSERWSLTGEYDRFNAYNAGLKWRIYSK